MASVSYQAIDQAGVVYGGTVEVANVEDLSQARKIAEAGAGAGDAVDVVAAWTNDGRNLADDADEL